jgi:hypothetical protein
MTTRSTRQLDLPSPARDAYLVASLSPVGGTPAAREAIAGAAAAIGQDPRRLLGFVHSCCFGPGCDAAAVHADLGLGLQGYSQHGSDAGALWEGVKTVASGYSDCVLVACGADGASCALLADRETAETLTRRSLRLHVGVSGPSSAEAEADALRVVRAMAAVEGGEVAGVDGDLVAHLAAMSDGLQPGQTSLAMVRGDVSTALALSAR